ncbi:unnamed protein product [Effrenium voratum]|nr:unnamed protein product [Effrenium voratum]
MVTKCHLKLGRCRSQEPLVPKDLWSSLPLWIALHAERGKMPKCWEGHRLYAEKASRAHPECTYCQKVGRGSVLICRKCPWWLICSSCARRPRLPPLQCDPLFFGPSTPRLLPALTESSQLSTRGSVVICPGGNYQFLVPHEGMPVAEYFAQQGFRAYVLRYRLLPEFTLQDMMCDLGAAANLLRSKGPVCAMGFSAGGHLVASLGTQRPLDAQVLVYPCIDGSDWAEEDNCGFWGEDFEQCLAQRPLVVALNAEESCCGPGPEG